VFVVNLHYRLARSVKREGLYYVHCSEICGINKGFMSIVKIKCLVWIHSCNLSLAITTGASSQYPVDADQLQALIFTVTQKGTQALSAQVEDLNNQVQALQQTSSGRQVPVSQDDEPSHQSRDIHSGKGNESEHDKPSVEEPSRTMVNVRVPLSKTFLVVTIQ
jgi:Cytochrome C oxidase subunit II, periplasmic domain